MTFEAYRNGKPTKAKLKAGVVTLPPCFKWYKPWTWRNGSRKGDVFIVEHETDFVDDLAEKTQGQFNDDGEWTGPWEHGIEAYFRRLHGDK